MKIFKILITGTFLFLFSCERKVEYKVVTQEEYVNSNFSYYLNRLPQGTKIVEVVKSTDERYDEWLIIKIKESYFLYRYFRSATAYTEVLVPINYVEKQSVDTTVEQ